MTPQRRKVVLLAALPAVFVPIAVLLTRTHETAVFLGLSAQFWMGALIGISLVMLAAAAYKFTRLSAED